MSPTQSTFTSPIIYLAMTGAVVSQALPMTGGPTVAYLSPQAGNVAQPSLGQSADQLGSIYYSTGAAPAASVGPTNGALLHPGSSARIPITAGQPAYVSAIGAVGTTLAIAMATES